MRRSMRRANLQQRSVDLEGLKFYLTILLHEIVLNYELQKNATRL